MFSCASSSGSKAGCQGVGLHVGIGSSSGSKARVGGHWYTFALVVVSTRWWVQDWVCPLCTFMLVAVATRG